MLLMPAQIKSKSFESRRNFFVFTRGGCVSCLRAYLSARLLPQSYQYRNPSEGADRVGGQLRGDKECPFNGATKSGRVWRKVPESDALSVTEYPEAKILRVPAKSGFLQSTSSLNKGSLSSEVHVSSMPKLHSAKTDCAKITLR